MTADQIIAQFQALVQDNVDTGTALFLLNEVKNTVESERLWALLSGLDLTQTASLGDTFETPHTLPSDFALPSPRGIYVQTDLIPYKQVPFESQLDFQSITYVYFIDFYNAKYYLCGSPGSAGKIQFFYRRFSPDMALVADGGLPWIFPARFHPLLVYEMCIKYFAADQGDKSRAWDDRWTAYAQRIREAMTAWDDQLQMLALQTESENMSRDLSGYPTIIDMGGGNTPMFG